MSTSLIPSIPSLAQMIAHLLIPCLPTILSSQSNPIMYDPLLVQPSIAAVSNEQIRAGRILWDNLWPDISQDFETLTAVRKAAWSPRSPLWRSTFEQGLISILSKNEALAESVAHTIRQLPSV